MTTTSKAPFRVRIDYYCLRPDLLAAFLDFQKKEFPQLRFEHTDTSSGHVTISGDMQAVRTAQKTIVRGLAYGHLVA